MPDAIPPERLYRYGAPASCVAYEGLKEEYYLTDFEPDEPVLGELGLDRARPIVVVRTPPEVSLYHRFENDLFAALLERLHGRRPPAGCSASCSRGWPRGRARGTMPGLGCPATWSTPSRCAPSPTSSSRPGAP